jgi:hypothetical protein
MSLLNRKLEGKTDTELATEIQKLKGERRAYARSIGPRRDDSHAAAGRLIAEATHRFQAKAVDVHGHVPGLGPEAAELAALHVLASPEFGKALQKAIDAASGLEDMSAVDFQKKIAGFDEQVEARKLELERRQKQARVDAAQQELAKLEEKD